MFSRLGLAVILIVLAFFLEFCFVVFRVLRVEDGLVPQETYGEFNFTKSDFEVKPRESTDRVSRSEHGLLGADRAGSAYHPNMGAWISKYSKCDPCEEDCAAKHLAFYEQTGNWARLVQEADVELADRRSFYTDPNWSDPDYGPRRRIRIASGYSNDTGEGLFNALFNSPNAYNPFELDEPRTGDGSGGGHEAMARGVEASVSSPREIDLARRYVAKRLQILADDMFMPWELSGGIDDHRQVNMVTCSFATRMRWNSFGIWVHIAGNNATVLRQQVDALGRTVRVTKYIKRLVASGPPFSKPLVAYINVMDFPCNVVHPYLNFFTKRGVKGILFPDDQAVMWGPRRSKIISAARSRSYGERNNSVFFLGSPNNKVRMDLRDLLESSEYRHQSDITIAVLEHKMFKHLLRPIEDHTRYRYILSIRGRTASSRDMSFQAMNSTVVRLDDRDSWFQWYHVLWEPYFHYLPLHPDNSTKQMCTLRRMMGEPESLKDAVVRVSVPASNSRRRPVGSVYNTTERVFTARRASFQVNERLASNMAMLGEILTQDVVDNYARYILRRYADMQTYTVDPDPVLYVKRMRSFASRKHRDVQVIPDDSSHVKYVFWRWLARRWKQLLSCRDPKFAKATNGTRKSCTYW